MHVLKMFCPRWRRVAIAALLSLPALAATSLAAADDPVAYATIDDAVYAAEARFQPGSGEHAPDFQAPNPWQQFHMAAFDDTITIAPYADGTPPWTWSMRLTHYGFTGSIQAVEAASPVLRDGKLEYARGLLTEWYRNGRRGLSQGFELSQRPAGFGTFVLRFRVNTELHPETFEPESAGRSVRYVDDAGIPRLYFGDLELLDATGRSFFPKQVVFDASTSTLELQLAMASASGFAQAVFPVRIDTIVYTQQRLTASDEEEINFGEYPINEFGYSVAISGTTALVGATRSESYYDPDIGRIGPDLPGAVYVFEKNTQGRWHETQQLHPPPAVDYELDLFGRAVAIAGNTIAVGAPGIYSERNEPQPGAPEGVVYLFERVSGVWTRTARLFDPEGSPGDAFGEEVELNGDTLLVKAWNDRNEAAPILGNSGSVSVFRRTNAGWQLETKLTPTFAYPGGRLLRSMAVDGNTIALATNNRAEGGFVREGTVHVYSRTAGGWKLSAQIEESQLHLGHADLHVGLQGNRLVAAADHTAVVFRRNGGAWVEEGRFTHPVRETPGQSFAFAGPVFLRGDRIFLRTGIADAALDQTISAVVAFQRAANNTWSMLSARPVPDPLTTGLPDFAISDTDLIVGSIFGEAAFVYPLRPGPEAPRMADLALTSSQYTVRHGNIAFVTYVITLANPGPGRATEVQVRDKLPAGALFYSVHATRGTLQTPKQWHQGTVKWTIGNVKANPDKLAQLRICAILKEPGKNVNCARVLSATTDPAPDNNVVMNTYVMGAKR